MRLAYFMLGIIVNAGLAQGNDAEEFNQDRFIDENGQLSYDILQTKDGPLQPHRNI